MLSGPQSCMTLVSGARLASPGVGGNYTRQSCSHFWGELSDILLNCIVNLHSGGWDPGTQGIILEYIPEDD